MTFIKVGSDRRIREALARIETNLIWQKEFLMSFKEDMDAKFAEMGAAVQEIAADLQDLISRLGNPVITPEDAVALLAEAQQKVTDLQALAATWTPPPNVP